MTHINKWKCDLCGREGDDHRDFLGVKMSSVNTTDLMTAPMSHKHACMECVRTIKSTKLELLKEEKVSARPCKKEAGK